MSKDYHIGQVPYAFSINYSDTYGNAIMDGMYVNIYMKAVNDDGKTMIGKLVQDVKVLAVLDSSGRDVFENTEEERVPAYMLFGLPEDLHLLFRKALYLGTVSEVEITLVPNTSDLTDEDIEEINSEEIRTHIEERTKSVDITTILSQTSDQVGDTTQNQSDETQNEAQQ